jgi:hypothetical protein
MGRAIPIIKVFGWFLFVASWDGPCPASEPVRGDAERGRVALTSTGYLKPAWSEAAYANASKSWGISAPDPVAEPQAYASAFNRRYGLHPAPYPNDGLPMGLRKGNGPGGSKQGLAIDCMVCHGGSIGGTSYVGLGNTQLDLKLLFQDMLKADGKRLPPSTFVVNSSRGTVNAGMFSVILLSLRNPDLSFRAFPMPLGANLPELDVPAWWVLGKKSTMYYDGRTDARSVRTNMQFLLAEKTLAQFEELEPTFRDIQAYLKSLTPPKYPFPIDRARAEGGRAIFLKTCARCHGTYGPGGEYPDRIVDLKEIGTDPARALGIAPRFVAHYNSTWFGQEAPVDETLVGYQAPPLDGIWATAPYLHNGSVPTLATLLKSSDRPSRFYRPPSTDFTYYDTEDVGWKFDRPMVGSETSPAEERARRLFDSSRFGLGNGGHTFGDALGDEERAKLIEYLKTL